MAEYGDAKGVTLYSIENGAFTAYLGTRTIEGFTGGVETSPSIRKRRDLNSPE
jgi:hypothetical protein